MGSEGPELAIERRFLRWVFRANFPVRVFRVGGSPNEEDFIDEEAEKDASKVGRGMERVGKVGVP